MKLSTKARYGVRALFDIAFYNEGKPTQARDIARRQEVPLRYLEQIFQELRRAELVQAKRGPKGGYSLARQAQRITLGDVVRAVQGPIELTREEPDPLPTRGGPSLCPDLWSEVAQKVSQAFDSLTIQDLVARGEALGLRRSAAERNMYFI
jgi:Rrf2 family protein